MRESPAGEEIDDQFVLKPTPKINTREAMFAFISEKRYVPTPDSRPPVIIPNIYKPGTYFVVAGKGSELIETTETQEQLEQWCKDYTKQA
jgi:hypothetical protein